MFYLKYRPQSISELDNNIVREQLESILKASSVPHAFLFTGPKGTGKTSTARILAKVLNAEVNKKKISSLNPSENDPNVAAITKGNSPDVIEIDAASHRKIDDIRNLISELKFAPISSKYKIYIIDEVHMLTKEAFNALLKSLEEPPSSTIFILATTEADMLPQTVVSRCLRIHFSKAGHDDIMSMLQRICTAEQLNIDLEALKYISFNSDGSFRDAAKSLELLSLEKKTTLADVKSILGHSSNYTILLTFISENKLRESIDWCERYYDSNGDFNQLIKLLLSELHAVLLVKNKIEQNGNHEYNFTVKELSQLMKLLQSAYSQQRYAPIDTIPLELAIIDYMSNKG